jgi:hypothetical protein
MGKMELEQELRLQGQVTVIRYWLGKDLVFRLTILKAYIVLLAELGGKGER